MFLYGDEIQQMKSRTCFLFSTNTLWTSRIGSGFFIKGRQESEFYFFITNHNISQYFKHSKPTENCSKSWINSTNQQTIQKLFDDQIKDFFIAYTENTEVGVLGEFIEKILIPHNIKDTDGNITDESDFCILKINLNQDYIDKPIWKDYASKLKKDLTNLSFTFPSISKHHQVVGQEVFVFGSYSDDERNEYEPADYDSPNPTERIKQNYSAFSAELKQINNVIELHNHFSIRFRQEIGKLIDYYTTDKKQINFKRLDGFSGSPAIHRKSYNNFLLSGMLIRGMMTISAEYLELVVTNPSYTSIINNPFFGDFSRYPN